MQARVPALSFLVLTLGCGGPESSTSDAAMDLHSHSRPDQVRVTALDLDLDLDFRAQQVSGTATLSLERHDPEAPLVLDIGDLTIEEVTGTDGSARSTDEFGPEPFLGKALHVLLNEADTSVTVRYRTSPAADALQWLAPEQTSSKAAPFLYTQGQAILTRTWIPLQDSPGARVTFQARVRAPKSLTVVMAAEAKGQDDEGRWLFAMPRAIPPYLIALACGNLTSRRLSDRCAVWAEPDVVEAAAAEFEDTPQMLRSCEELFGPYRWGRYDVLILPPAFPFGGMENPTLTFATPTILAGDKSLVGLIAHELAHSWSGNLVTNATWRDFWLNEGFTVYLEQRIMEAVYGPERSAMEILLGMQGLRDELAELPTDDEVLHIDLAGRNPDDGMTAIAYDKGAAFLRRLEECFGRETFDAFLLDYFAAHSFQSITTEQFKAYLDEHLLKADPSAAAKVDIERWIHAPGLPEDCPEPESAAFTAVEAKVRAWRDGTAPEALRTADWTTHEWLHFLASLPDDVDAVALTGLDAAFGLTRSRNAEILAAWLRLTIRHGYSAADAALEAFLLGVGRRKFLKPLYEELARTEPGRERARRIYATARQRYHAITQRTLDGMLGSPDGR